MSQRSLRAGTRAQSVKEEVRRSMQVIDRVRHWEKKWVTVSDTSLRLYKWVPVSSAEMRRRERKGMREANKENKRQVAAASQNSSTSAISAIKPDVSMSDDSMSTTMNEDSNTGMSFTSESQSQSAPVVNGSSVGNLSFASRIPPNPSSSVGPTP